MKIVKLAKMNLVNFWFIGLSYFLIILFAIENCQSTIYTRFSSGVDLRHPKNTALHLAIMNRKLRSRLKEVKHDFETNTKMMAENILESIEYASRIIFSRDPSAHTKGITYESLDYFIQGYVADQRFLRQDEMCTPTCSDYSDTVYYNHTDGKYFPHHSICTGRIRSCTNSPVERIYLASRNSTRRYDGLSNIPSNGESFKYWGREPTYNGIISTALYSGFCRICACTCDMVNSSKSIRYVDLRPRRSTVSAAFVITGIRFKIINRILYLQIQEGELKNGKIIAETTTWKKIEDTDRDHDNDKLLFKLDYDNRSLDLADLTLPSSYAVTMVKFMVIDGIIGLQIQGFPMIDGELNVSVSKKLSNQSAETLSSRPIFHPKGMDIPIRETMKNNRVSESNQFLLKFETSDWDKDVGQNVVPFIDLQDVVTDPTAPVAGIGIHVRYGDTSGGFLAPKLIIVDKNTKLEHSRILKNAGKPVPSVPPSGDKSNSEIYNVADSSHPPNILRIG